MHKLEILNISKKMQFFELNVHNIHSLYTFSSQNGSRSVQNGNSSVQNGNSSVRNGKIIISINLKKLQRQYGGPVVMVVDNAPYHSNIEEVFSEEEFLWCEVLRLGPYSPMFNPIKQVWSLIKAYVEQELVAKIVSILAVERRDGLSITEELWLHWGRIGKGYTRSMQSFHSWNSI